MTGQPHGASGDIVVVHRPIGPFGHTFDEGARHPLFNASSYLVRPFRDATDWDFAEVRFRRASGNPDIDLPVSAAAETDLAGREWTKPTWIQFIPSSLFGAKSGSDIQARARHVGDAHELTLRLPDPPADSPDPPELAYHHYFVVLVKPVKDYLGREDQPVYSGLVRLSGNGGVFSGRMTRDTGAGLGNNQLRGHLMEVQADPRFQFDPDDAAFWQDLIWGPKSDSLAASAPDCLYRITRFSQPAFPITFEA